MKMSSEGKGLVNAKLVKRFLREEVIKEMKAMKKKARQSGKLTTEDIDSMSTEKFMRSDNFETVMTAVFARYTPHMHDKLAQTLEHPPTEEQKAQTPGILNELFHDQRDAVIQQALDERKEERLQKQLEFEKQLLRNCSPNIVEPEPVRSAEEEEMMRHTVRQVLKDAGIHIEDDMIFAAQRIQSK